MTHSQPLFHDFGGLVLGIGRFDGDLSIRQGQIFELKRDVHVVRLVGEIPY
jgi:hypothetical protein